MGRNEGRKGGVRMGEAERKGVSSGAGNGAPGAGHVRSDDMALDLVECKARVQFPGAGGIVFKTDQGFKLTARGPWVWIEKDDVRRVTPLANVLFGVPCS